MLRPLRRTKTTNPMQLIYGFDNIPELLHPVVTVGSYDGLHKGHQILISRLIACAKSRGGVSVVLTFEPHPRITLGQDEGLKLLTSLEEKQLLLERLGVDYLVVIPFDKAFSQLSNEQFVNDYLIGKLAAEEIVIGYNHHFGRDKSGDYNYLCSEQPTLAVTQVEQQTVESDKVSSTVVRGVISAGDMAAANRLLGHSYIIIGTSNAEGRIVADKYKLLPPSGSYRAVVNGVEQSITICDNEIYTDRPSEKVIIEL